MATPTFSTTVYGTAFPPAGSVQLPAECDPFWTQMNQGYCSDTMGNFVRRDGTPVPVGGVNPSQRWFPSVSNEMVLVGVGVLALLLFAAAVGNRQ